MTARTVAARGDGRPQFSAAMVARARDVAGERAAPDPRRAARAREVARTARLQDITAALSRAVTPEDVARTLVERALEALDATSAGLWIVDPDGAHATLVHARGLDAPAETRYRKVPLGTPAPEPLADAIRRGEPVFAESRTEAELRWPQLVQGRRAAPSFLDYAFACLPLETEAGPMGCIALVFDGARALEYDERVFLLVVARQAAQALLRARLFASERAARAEAEAARQRAAFLAEASALFGASLEWEETLASVARLAVPAVADWCSVEVPDTLAPGAGPLAIAHVDPAKLELAREWRRRYPPVPGGPRGAPAVIRTGRAELYEEIPDALLVASAVDAEHLRIIRALGMSSAMVVPLSARGRTLGAVTFVSAESGRRYGPSDLAMAEDLGRRAGLAVDNARLYDEAQRAIRARDEVLAVVSHDLKNPLEAVLLSSSLLLRSPESPRVRHYAEVMGRSARRMDRLIRDLLDLSSMDAGKFRVEARPEPLGPVLEEAVALLAPLAAERRVALAVRGEVDGVQVSCDRERVVQVLSNLVGNALQFTPDGGHVSLEVAVEGGEARVSVRDDGPGIPPEDLPRVFDRYWKSRSRRGTGLGLAIARGIVEAHGGRIEVESAVGAGATFRFALRVVGERPDTGGAP